MINILWILFIASTIYYFSKLGINDSKLAIMALIKHAFLNYPCLIKPEVIKNHDSVGIPVAKFVGNSRSDGRNLRRFLRVNVTTGPPRDVQTLNGNKVIGTYVDGTPSFAHAQCPSGKENSNEEPNHVYLLGRFVADRIVYRRSEEQTSDIM